MEAETDRALVAAADRLVVLADHTKWGTVGISSIVGLGGADVLVTDDRSGRRGAREQLDETGGRAGDRATPADEGTAQ